MEETPKQRQRTIQVVSLSELSSKEDNKLPNDLPTLLANLREILLQKSENDEDIDSNTIQYIEAITTKIRELANLTQPTEIFDTLQATFKTYINDLLSITKCLHILSNETFQEIFLSLINTETTIDLFSIFENDSIYARTVFYRSFDLLSLPVITDFLTDKYPNELFSHVAYVLRVILDRIQTTIEYVVLKKNDLQNQTPNIRLLIEYIDKNKQNVDQLDMTITVDAVLTFIWTLVDDTILVPTMIEANCSNYVVKWISMKDLSLDIQLPCIHILHNMARHEKGVKALNDINCINILKEFKQRILDPNRDNNEDLYVELRLLYCMVLSLISEPKENREELKNLRKPLDQLMQLVIDAGQSNNNKCGGFHVSEPIVVLTKLCVHDEILQYVLNESSVKNMQAKSRIEFFCQLLMKFRGALATENDLDQLTLTALFNILWSISFHDEYIEELKSNSKFLITVKSLVNDDGESWVEQYVPKHMSSISKAASGILWNLDENNPARAARTTAVPETNTTISNDTKKTDRMRIMVSYCHADKEFCHQLVDALQKDTRLEVWVDFAYCHTEDFWEEIGEAIEKADAVLFLMSKDYQDSKSCRQEVMYAKDSLKKRFIPIYMKKDFIATGWLGVRIVGPQYIRFGKKSFEDTMKELTKLIHEDKKQQESEPNKETKPTPVIENKPSPVLENEPTENSNHQTKPNENSNHQTKPNENSNHQTKPTENNHTESNLKPPKKPAEQWTRKDIRQWFDDNEIHQELIDLYNFQHGRELLLYSQCLRPDWQIEYNDMRERYQRKYNTQLYRDQFVRFVGAVHSLQPSKPTSKSCVIF